LINVDKILNKININKATGADGIPAKIVKNCKSCIALQLTALVNLSIENNCFSDKLKEAQVTPIFKKILFKILSTFSFVILLNSKSGTCSLLFNISLILGWFEELYTASIPILSTIVEKKILK
jgi:hypothetical protein